MKNGFVICEFFEFDGVAYCHLRNPQTQEIIKTVKVDTLSDAINDIMAK